MGTVTKKIKKCFCVKKIFFFILLFFCTANLFADWVLVWQDEFNSPSINTSYWGFDTGCSGWGNNEWENYTTSSNNAFIENGNLVIQAINTGGGNCGYTSARLKTQGKVHFTYGRIEARIKMPYGQGIWPAFWMLGENIGSVGWPRCGEIDIVEMVGGGAGKDNVCVGTAHWDNGGHQYSGGSISVPWPEKLADNYHVYSVEWNSSSIKWFFDGNQYYSLNIGGGMEEFQDKDFFIILNLAVGGNWPGYPDGSTVFPQRMYVDYVRWYQWQEGGPTSTPTPTPTPKIFNIPGTVECEDYLCCEGTGFHDSDSVNQGGQYRNDGVDIEVCTDTGGGYNIGWTAAGEWLNYRINITGAGSYNIGVRVACQGQGGTFHLEIDGVNISGTMTVPDTGGWQNWQTVNVNNINLSSGTKTLKLVMDTNGPAGPVGNFNYIIFTLNNPATSTPTRTFTRTNTPTSTQVGQKLDDFTDGEFTKNNWLGAWGEWSAPGCSITREIVSDTPGSGQPYSGKISGNIVGSNWPSITAFTDFYADGSELNLNNITQGIRLWMKGNKGTGTSVNFYIQIISANITDYSYWRYNYNPQGNWSFLEIPWSSFSDPGWGQGVGLSLSDVLQRVKGIQFSIADTTGDNANNIGNNWYIDEIELFGPGLPVYTPTFTTTPSATRTNTNISTFTPTQTRTFTPTATRTFTLTNTATKTETPNATVTATMDVLIPLQTGMRMTCQFINNTGGEFSNSEIYAMVIALNSDGKFCHLDSAGNMILCNPGENASSYFIPLSAMNGFQFPQPVISARLYISLGSTLNIPVIDIGGGNVGIVYPNIENPTDPNLNKIFDFIEFNLQNNVIFCNTTQVDMFGIPLEMRLYENVSGGYALNGRVGITLTASEVFNKWVTDVPSQFLNLFTGNRIIAPIHGSFGPGRANATYFDNYINDIWEFYKNTDLVITLPPKTYTGRVGADNRFAFTTPGDPTIYYVSKPTTQDVFAGYGALATGNPVELALEAQICAAFNRHVMENSSNFNNVAAYYQNSPANFYSKFWHSISINNKAYGFCYDDVNDQSTTMVSTDPRGLVIIINGGYLTGTPTLTPTRTLTPTFTPTFTMTLTDTGTRTYTATGTFTFTPTQINTNTATDTVTSTVTSLFTSTFTATRTNTYTMTETMIYTATNTPTDTITNTITNSITSTFTNTHTNTVTLQNTSTFTATASNTQIFSLTFTPTKTVTVTGTNTFTFTVTLTQVLTFTNTATKTFTLIFTGTATYTATPTVVPTETDELKIIKEIPVILYPNPVINRNDDVKIKFAITKSAIKYKIKIYTTALRFIIEKNTEAILSAGKNEIVLEAKYIKNLSPGIYYYLLIIEDAYGKTAKSKINQFIVF